jgi:hypothetical protein
MNVTCRIDTTNWMAAHQVLHRYAINPSESLHKAVAFVLKDAKENTPVVDPATIVSELGVLVTPRLGKRGQPLSIKSAKNQIYDAIPGGSGKRAPSKFNDVDKFPDVPLSWLIVMARANPDSGYNQRNSGRYMIPGGSIFKGQPRSSFAAIMQGYVSRMTKQRRSSTGFFKISWNALLKAIAAYVPSNYKATVLKWAGGNGGKQFVRDELGTFTPARQNTPYTTCMIENNLGMEGVYPELDKQRNEAAHRILEPVLQAAIDRNFHKQVEIAAQRGLLDKSPELRLLGFNVS